MSGNDRGFGFTTTPDQFRQAAMRKKHRSAYRSRRSKYMHRIVPPISIGHGWFRLASHSHCDRQPNAGSPPIGERHHTAALTEPQIPSRVKVRLPQSNSAGSAFTTAAKAGAGAHSVPSGSTNSEVCKSYAVNAQARASLAAQLIKIHSNVAQTKKRKARNFAMADLIVDPLKSAKTALFKKYAC